MKLTDVCKNCGLPKELCVCGDIAKEFAKVKIYTERKRFKKFMTIIEGITEEVKPKELTKKLKTKLACGGTYKDGKIELQGKHVEKVKKILLESGFTEDQIEV